MDMSTRKELVEKIKAMVKDGMSSTEIAKKLGINESTIRSIVNQ